ncbi:heavy metal translocatin [Fomitiporia mediterranea MF3/22]|uniref:heavy metal translocatin n=1 Tax=Fomitiporia mediterranea (strain MF3/22) TaxID=694068 RepID=UPI0004408095|nr:heavy metal translocatin [Fomitiporia mediterranea MF3/22]EJD01002.1 heavy metal translocatin [Fomitiporia mediterranea MF3/22]
MVTVNTIILISNLHCSSCVSTIRETLLSLSPPPTSINTSIVSQTVSVEHDPGLSPEAIKAALDDAGFDLVSTPEAESYRIRRSPSYLERLTKKREKHAEQCLLCQQDTGIPAVEQPETISEHSENATSDLKAGLPKSGSPAQQGPFLATFSVGGMTCASCVGNVTKAASEIQGVTDVAVNLVGKSATALLQSKDLADEVIRAIEDGGYEATLVSLEPLQHGREEETGQRSVSLRIEGMFCQHCPEKIMKKLEMFGDKVTVDEPLGSYSDSMPVIRLTYTPAPPDFTIRHIISEIASAKSPPFDVSIAKPLSLEERARAMHIEEQRRLLIQLVSAVIIAIPTFIIGIVYMTLVPASNPTRMWFMHPLWTGNTSRAEWALFFLATPAMFFSASHFHRRSIKEIYSIWRPGSKVPIWRRFVRFGSMNLLVSLGVSIAYFASIALLALAAVESPDPHGEGNSTTYFDSVVFLTMFLLAGRFLEAYSKGRTADAVTALGQLRPTEAFLLGLEDDDLSSSKVGMRMQKVNVDLLEVGDTVRVPHGATPPADGIIVSRDGSQFDESSLTGESKPIKKENGEQVFVGTINRGRAVEVKITTLGGETMLDQIVKVVREGQTKRAPIERFADVITGYFVPIITLLSILTFIIWVALGTSGALPPSYLDISVGGWPVWSLQFAIAVFVVACPCGIGLAAPTALLVGSGLAAKFGILVRGGGEAFQEAAQLDAVVFDKTGTLTEGGEPKVTNVDLKSELMPSWNRDAILSIAHVLESSSSHPLAEAIRRYCETQEDLKLTNDNAAVIEETAGRGLKGKFSTPPCEAIIGNERWIEEHGASFDATQQDLLSQWQSEGNSVIAIAIREQPSGRYAVLGIFAAADKLRPEAPAIVEALQKQGLGTWMISGDNPTTAKAVAKTVGIPETNVIAGVLPHQKAERIHWLQQVGKKREMARWKQMLGMKRLNERCVVAMVGDGINDAPALSAADVSVAVGSGSDVAISSASFILIKSDLRSLLTLTDLSRRVFRRVKFNFLWAVMYNAAALPIAAGVIYPAGHARLSPVWASLAMALSSVSVVLSSLMLRLYREPKISLSN